MKKTFFSREGLFSDTSLILLITLLKLAVNMCFHGQYGYFRDELYYIACSDHLAWGYVDQPPLSIFILAFSRLILGNSLHAIRFLPAVAGAGVVVLTGLMVRKIGGDRFAQVLGALAAAFSPVVLGNGARYFSMNAFDLFFWAWAAYLVIVIIRDERPKLWLLFGAAAGLGMMNKYSMGFLIAGLVIGLLLTRHRKHLASKWFWLGALIACVIFLPHILWQIRNGFPSLEFMRRASEEKNIHVPLFQFLASQTDQTGWVQSVIWLFGLGFLFFHKKHGSASSVRAPEPAIKTDGKKEKRSYHYLAWMYLFILAVMLIQNAKPYYLSPVYPPLIAGGAVLIGTLLKKPKTKWFKPVLVFLLLFFSLVAMPFAIPVLPVETFIAYSKTLGMTPKAEERSELGELPQYYADMFGWEEMVEKIAGIYEALAPEERNACVIYARNYGEAGAIDFFGKKYGLPKAVCAHNSYWYWGSGNPDAAVAIIIGNGHDVQENLDDLRSPGRFDEVIHAATTQCRYCMPYENNRPIFLCRGFHFKFKDIWEEERFFI